MIQIDNRKIGQYTANLIKRQYRSARAFCKAYLEKSGEEVTDDAVNNLANRVSQIKSGKNAMQIHDLPIFSELLDVSFEQLLSAGTSGKATHTRATNYTIAQSHDEEEWRAYIAREDTPVLNPDEFGKTVLEYALDFGNYAFLKFLMDKEYIWFDSREDKEYWKTFGAGTSIQKQKYTEMENGWLHREPDMHDLEYQLRSEDQLRLQLITMAADHGDMKMLRELRARELPELYMQHYALLSTEGLHIDARYDRGMLKHIAQAESSVLTYFTTPFPVKSTLQPARKQSSNEFLFPAISQLLDMLVTDGTPRAGEALDRAAAHNKEAYSKLQELIQMDQKEGFGGTEITFDRDGNMVRARRRWDLDHGLVTNIAHVTKTSADEGINKLITELNEAYEQICAVAERRQ